jgi:cytochrome c-type biogenesis protein CcmE
LPVLFREGQGIVAVGAVTNKILIADTVLAKHDENYLPREVKESLEEQGVWQGDKNK